MSHSVAHHLSVTPEAYDAEIRRFVPGYEAMLDEVVGAIVRLRSADAELDVLELGAGTGALSYRVAERMPKAKITMLDADAAMLARAEGRMSHYRQRVTFHHGSFAGALPRCDVAVASLALHHVHDAVTKRDVYANVLRSLPTGGFLVSADATIPLAASLAADTYTRWAAHLVANGDTEEQAYARFDEWAEEDRYFSIEQELDMMRAAGFDAVEVLWRAGPTSVFVATA